MTGIFASAPRRAGSGRLPAADVGPVRVRQVDSGADQWTHSECRPPSLSGTVDLLWHFEGRMALLRERHFPNGMLGLILHLGPRFREIAPLPNDAYPLISIGGQQISPFLIEAPAGECRVLGVELHPAGARALLGLPLSEITGTTVDLEAILGAEARALAERCGDAPTVRDCLAYAAEWIASRASRAEALDPAVTWMAGELVRSHGTLPIADLQRHIGHSRARLAAAFRDQVGLTAKRYARVLRFRRALRLLTEERLPFSTLAVVAGYYDQPHMNAEFRELAGFTPGELLAATRYSGSASLAEPA